MDPNRFDSLARRLGNRLSRRDVMRAGAGAALGVAALGTLRPAAAQDAATSAADRFISVRTYPYNVGTVDAAQQGLQGLIGVMQQQPGFISFDIVYTGDSMLTISTFLDQPGAVAAAQQEDSWIAENASTILRGAPTIQSGDVLLRSSLEAGCPCTTGTGNSCGSDALVCCPTSGTPGGDGVCLTAVTTCPAVPDSEATPTSLPACTGEGCACNGGVQGACDDGLICCQSGESVPGGPGTCMAEEECDPATPVPVCTSEGCECASGTEQPCDDGLECCGATEPGGPGTCQSSC
jgi:hypothetical protein